MARKSQPPDGIASLIEGYKRFKSDYFERAEIYKDLVQNGQKPKVLVIACCDSRVDPAIVTRCNPGELFVIRNVANLAPPFDLSSRHHSTSAALEFGVKSLGVTDIIVFGHSHCGGVSTLMRASEDKRHSQPYDFISSWMTIAEPAKQEVLEQYPHCSLDEQRGHCERKLLLISRSNLMTFPWIQERVEAGQLSLHAWYFNLSKGIVEAHQPETDMFVPLDDVSTTMAYAS